MCPANVLVCVYVRNMYVRFKVRVYYILSYSYIHISLSQSCSIFFFLNFSYALDFQISSIFSIFFAKLLLIFCNFNDLFIDILFIYLSQLIYIHTYAYIYIHIYLGQVPRSPSPLMEVVSRGIDFVLAFLPWIFS